MAVHLQTQVCTSPLPNALSAQIAVPSNLNISNWHACLQTYSHAIIVDYLEFGWPINYIATTPPQPVRTNHPSVSTHASHVHQFIATEVSLQATAGPFKAHPFHCSLMISPLLTVPKKNSTYRQIVMDLSFPVGCSVNDGIPKDTFLGEPFQLRPPGVKALATLIRHCGPNCLIFKKKISVMHIDSFRLTLVTIITLDIPLTIYYSSTLSLLLDFVQLLWLANVLPMPFNFFILFMVTFQPIMLMILVVVTHLEDPQIPFMPFNTCFISLASTRLRH